VAALLVGAGALAWWMGRARPVVPPTVPPSTAPRSSPRAQTSPSPTPRASTRPEPAGPERAQAGLRIESDVPGATVFVDRKYVGTTPLTVRDVPAGSHDLTASAEGFDMLAQTIEVTGGAQTVALRFREVRLDARADVVHKHGIGSCRGGLTATPAGVRYEGSKREDSFSAALVDVTALEVDYLDQSLKLKLRSGRTYRFSPAEGGPDALLVFKQQVDKATARLRAVR
jgi:hypothetical protein